MLTEPTPLKGRTNHALTADTPLSDREIAFKSEYLVDFDATRAARAVGYKGKHISKTASRLLGAPHIQAAIKREIESRAQRLRATVDNTVQEIARLSFSDVGDLFDVGGNLKSVKELPREVRACIASIKVVKKNLIAGDNAVEYVYEIKFWNKPKALELLATHLGLLQKDQAERDAVDVPAFTLPVGTPGVRVH